MSRAHPLSDHQRIAALAVCVSLLVPLGAPAAAAQACPPPIPVPQESALVYDDNGNGVADVEGDTWLYSATEGQRPGLLGRFRAGVAEFYDDVDGNGRLDYSLSGCGLAIAEPSWRVKVSRRNASWFRPDGYPDWNLDVTVDSGWGFSGEDAEFELQQVSEMPGPESILVKRAGDGAADLTMSFWTDENGLPSVEINDHNVTGPHLAIIVNKNPHLDRGADSAFPARTRLLAMNWTDAKIRHVKHLIPTRTNPDGEFFYLNRTFAPGEVLFGLETPMAFYDLDRDGEADLTVRGVTEEFQRNPPVGFYNEFRYTWMQDGTLPDYRVYVVGRAPYTYAEPLGNVVLAHVPYEQLPAFPWRHQWLGAVFAHDEAHNYTHLGEGIYENLYYTGEHLRARLLAQRPGELPPYIPTFLGMREEYWFWSRPRLVELYFSPIDRRLHLAGAQKGLLLLDARTSTEEVTGFAFSPEELATGNIEASDYLEYDDNDGDGFFDTWTRTQTGQAGAGRTHFFHLGRTAALVDSETIRLKRADRVEPPFLWKALPPQSEQDRKRLGQMLEAGDAMSVGAADLAGMFAARPGHLVELSGITSGTPVWQDDVLNVPFTAAVDRRVPAGVGGEEQLIAGAAYVLVASEPPSIMKAGPPARPQAARPQAAPTRQQPLTGGSEPHPADQVAQILRLHTLPLLPVLVLLVGAGGLLVGWRALGHSRTSGGDV